MAARSTKPRMREAYPRLNIVDAMSALRRGEPNCVFQTGGVYLGRIEFGVTPNEDIAVLDGEFIVPKLRGWSGRSTVSLMPNPNGVDLTRKVMLCPSCGRRCGVLIWIGHWACRGCDGLIDRRQLIGSTVAAAAELERLKDRTRNGRRHGQHQSTYERELAWIGELKQRLKEGRRGRRPIRVASFIQNRTIFGEWLSHEAFRTNPAHSHGAMPPLTRDVDAPAVRAPVNEAPFEVPKASKLDPRAWDPNADSSGNDDDEISSDEM